MTKQPMASAMIEFDIPPPVILVRDRRLQDRRIMWRGGRRDSDWMNRPSESLQIVAREHRRSVVRRMLGF